MTLTACHTLYQSVSVTLWFNNNNTIATAIEIVAKDNKLKFYESLFWLSDNIPERMKWSKLLPQLTAKQKFVIWRIPFFTIQFICCKKKKKNEIIWSIIFFTKKSWQYGSHC